MRDSTIAAGNFADTSDGAANQQRVFAAMVDDLQIKLGTALLPALTTVGAFMIDDLIPTVETIAGTIADFTAALADNEPALAAIAVGLAGLSVSIITTHVPAILAKAAAWASAAAAMIAANAPVILITGAVAALAAGIIWAYQNVEWFQAIVDNLKNFLVNTAWPAIRTVFDAMTVAVGVLLDYWQFQFNLARDVIQWLWDKAVEVTDGITSSFDGIVDFITGLPSRIATAAAGMWDGIKNAFRAALNFIIDGWNALEFSLPAADLGPLGSIGGFTIGVPDIPRMVSGGISSGATTLVGERGPELVDLPAGARVTPNHALGSAHGDIHITVNEAGATGDEIARALAWQLRTGAL